MTVSAVSPWRTALPRERCLPASVFGPVLLCALRRLASIWRNEVIAGRPRQLASFCNSPLGGPPAGQAWRLLGRCRRWRLRLHP